MAWDGAMEWSVFWGLHFYKTKVVSTDALGGTHSQATARMSNCENMVLNFSKKVQQIEAFAVLF